MNFRLRVWRQPNAKAGGKLLDYEAREISPNTSFLEMLRSHSTPIAAKAFAVLARSRLTEKHTAPITQVRSVSFI